MFSRIFNLPKKEEKKEHHCEWHVNLDDFQAAPRCQCGKCLPMRKGRESVCCLEIVEVKKRTGRLTCITDHDGFKSLCLDHHVVEDAIYQYVGEVGGYVDDTPAFELPKIGRSNIRVLVFKDCDKKGKSLVFDSDAVAEVKEDEELSPNIAKNLQNTKGTHQPCSPSRALPSRFKFLKPKSDIKMLGEMIFGSVTMAYRGSLVKVHHIRTPPQLLLSKVFAVRSRSSAQAVCDGNQSGSFNQSNPIINQGRSMSSDSIAIPSMSNSPDRGIIGSVTIPRMSTPSVSSRSNLSFTSNASFESSLNISDSISSLHSPTPSPRCSLNRRWQRSQMTRLENYQHSKLKMEHSDEMQTYYRRQPKIGVGVIFKLWESKEEKNRVFQDFLFTHYSIFEEHVQRLRSAIEKSLHSKKNFFVSVIEAVENFKQNILSFYSAPRLLEPVWLNMMNIRDKQEEIAERFITTLMKAMDIFEKKEESYFLSSLLTAVLSHHLAWVPTVMPGGSAPNRAYLDKHASMTLDVLARCHPYNPLWAQLGDLFGTVGYPPKITKTVVVGKDPTLVRQILYILSYFIRCSEVKEYSLKILENVDDDDFSLRCCDKLSTYTVTPTNTPDNSQWKDSFLSKQNRELVNDKKERDNTITESEKLADDQEEICNCMCSVLQSIDYIGTKGLRNFKKLSSVIKTDKSRHVEFKNVKNSVQEHRDKDTLHKNIETDRDSGPNDYKNYIQKQASFICYCCPDKQHAIKQGTIDALARRLPRQNSGGSSENCLQDDEPKSCVCGDMESSEYGSETRSNQCTLSRNSSCVSCFDAFRKFEIRSQDSDYASINNEEHWGNGIELDLRDIDVADEEMRTEDDDDLLSMNLLELQIPESEIEALPQRNFDHKVELPNFGRSLLAGYCDKFIGDFALHGVRSIDMKALEKELHMSVKYSVLDETISDAAYIVADIDKRTCQLVSISRNEELFSGLGSEKITKTDLFGSSIVSELLESLKGLWHLNIPFQFCLMHLEDRLKDIYNTSKVLAEFSRTKPDATTKEMIKRKMRLTDSDLELVLAAGSTHCQYLQQSIN